VVAGMNPIDVWLNKLRHIRKFLKGWAKNQSGKYKKGKERLLAIIDHFVIKAETNPLGLQEREELKKANDGLNKLRREEESKWAQRAKVKHIQEGGIIRGISILLQMVNIERRIFFNWNNKKRQLLERTTLRSILPIFIKVIWATEAGQHFFSRRNGA
jgi:hypothetical protein